jgi:DNA-binding XRE family transcriptional regulator
MSFPAPDGRGALQWYCVRSAVLCADRDDRDSALSSGSSTGTRPLSCPRFGVHRLADAKYGVDRLADAEYAPQCWVGDSPPIASYSNLEYQRSRHMIHLCTCGRKTGPERLIRRLRQARVECGLSQADVAKRLARSQSYVSKCETGQLRLDVVQIRQFARLYGRKMSFFIGEDE